MIRALFTRDKTGDIIRVSVSGHADFADYGQDIVCASASVLLLSTVNALEEYVGLDTGLSMSDGTTVFQVTAIDEATRLESQALVNALEMAYLALQEEYGEYISIMSTEE